MNYKKTPIQRFIEKANIKHQNKYDYSKVNYVHSQTKVIIICSIHGDFEQSPSNHLKGRQCKKCSHAAMGKRYQQTAQRFIEKANIKHQNKYDYSKVNYTDRMAKVTITCSIHGDFDQKPIKHLAGQGCKKCATQQQSLTVQQFIQRANETHLNKYDYSKVNYVNMSIKVTITCSIHGDFEQSPGNHLSPNYCPKCSYKTEMILLEHLQSKYSTKISCQKTFEWLVYKKKQRIDFYIEEFNIAIELMGRQHFEPSKYFKSKLDDIIALDMNKERLLQQNNISIICIFQEDVYSDKFEWQLQLSNAIDFIKNKNQQTWSKICIGSIYK